MDFLFIKKSSASEVNCVSFAGSEKMVISEVGSSHPIWLILQAKVKEAELTLLPVFEFDPDYFERPNICT